MSWVTELYSSYLRNHPTMEAVNHPPHYTTGKIEVIDFIEDQKLGFHAGNVVKYICRASHKGKELEDLRKAQWYLNRLIQALTTPEGESHIRVIDNDYSGPRIIPGQTDRT